jgi:hypothetical protein
MEVIKMSQALRYQTVLIFHIHFKDRCNILLPEQMTFVSILGRELKRFVSPCVESYFKRQEMVELS